MSWAPVTMRWPEQSTQWMGELGAAKDLASGEMGSTALRLAALDGLVVLDQQGLVVGVCGEIGRAVLEDHQVAVAAQ